MKDETSEAIGRLESGSILLDFPNVPWESTELTGFSVKKIFQEFVRIKSLPRAMRTIRNGLTEYLATPT